jgi:peptidoglycan/LPS O-acetylase OafA/YrhL
MDVRSVLSLFRGAVQDLRVRPRGNVPALDMLRSLAILLVFNSHYSSELQALPWVQALPVFNRGWTGVDLFFVLSGYLIGSQLWKEAKYSDGIQVGRFLLRRGLRIWPLYYAFVALIALEGLFGRNLSGLWVDSCFLSNHFHNQVGGGWSLSNEEQFYILAPVTIAFLVRWFKPRHLWVLPVSGLILLVSDRWILIHMLSYQFVPLYTHADGLAVGGLLAWFAVFRPELIRSKHLRLPVCAAMVFVGSGLYYIDRQVLSFTATALIFGAAVLWGLGLERTPTLLDWHGFYLISRLSYGMYLNQFGLLEHLGKLWLVARAEGGEPVFWALYPVCVLASMAVAFLTFQLIEWPFLQIRARWVGSKKQAQPQSVAEAASAP